MTVSIRRARPEDVPFVVELLPHEEVEPFLAAAGTKDGRRRCSRSCARARTTRSSAAAS